jgi:hypothetical protein
MATLNAIPSNVTNGIPVTGVKKVFVVSNTVDLDKLGAANGDVVQALPVWDGIRVLGVEVEVVTASDAATSATATVGDGDNASGFVTSVNLKSVGVTTTPGAYGYSKRYTTNDTIDLTLTYSGATTVKGKVVVRAVYAYMK